MYPLNSGIINVKNNNNFKSASDSNSKDNSKTQSNNQSITIGIDTHNNNIKSLQNNGNTCNIECEVNKDDLQSNKNQNQKSNTTSSESVTSVTCVTATPPQYPCYFCGNDFKTNIDFDMALHLLEFHKQKLLKLPIKGNLDVREDYLISLTKRKLRENSKMEEISQDDESC